MSPARRFTAGVRGGGCAQGCLGYHHRAGEKGETKQQEGAAAAEVTLATKSSSQKKVEKVKSHEQ